LDPAPALKQIEETLKGWEAKTAYQRIARPFVPGVKGEHVVIETPDKANAVYAAGLTFPISDADPDDPALEVADFLFGSGTLSSRLGVRVRQKEGLSYGVRSAFSADSLDKSAKFQMLAICNPKNIDKVNASILDETDKMRKEGASETEVKEAKKAFLSAAKVSRGSDGTIASELKQLLYAGRTFAYEVDLEKKIEALTAEEVSAAFKKYIDPTKLVIVEAGDFKKKGPTEK
jgi:zinc protease